MKKLLLLFSVLVSPFLVSGQETLKSPPIKRNTLYFEFFGQGLYNAFTFDRLLHVERKVKNSFSAGLTIIPHPELFVLAAPVSYNFLFGKHDHHLELGFGFTFMYLRRDRIHASEWFTDQNGNWVENEFTGRCTDLYTYFTPKIGYRFQKPVGGIFLRLTITPPIAGINRIGDIKGGGTNDGWAYTEYFTSAAFFGYRAFPWAGFSVGWTLKK